MLGRKAEKFSRDRCVYARILIVSVMCCYAELTRYPSEKEFLKKDARPTSMKRSIS